jgi:phosphoesterase RecJ-like protein
MREEALDLLKRHSTLVLTTHQNPDPDGLGAETVFAQICRDFGKQVRIINAESAPKRFSFMDRGREREVWEHLREPLPPKAALVILDTSDEYNIGRVREFIGEALEVFVIDHHEPSPFCTFRGYFDNTASSVCEMAVELAMDAGVTLNPLSANAAYSGIVYDSGSFAYSKTTARTFRAALSLVEAGVNPYEIYHELHETASTGVLLLQKKVLSTLKLYNEGRAAVQLLKKEDLSESGAQFDDAEHFVNEPMKANDIAVSVLIKENQEGKIRCSLRSKGGVNVSKIAQSFGGGGHVSAAGFHSRENMEKTLELVLEKITGALEQGSENGKKVT